MIEMITAVESRLDVGEEQVRTHAVVDPTKKKHKSRGSDVWMQP